MLNVTTAKLSGLPGSTGWSQIHEFIPDNPQKLINRGKLYVVVSISETLNGIETLNLGREIFKSLEEEYYGNNFGGAFDALQKALNKVSDKYKNISSRVSVTALSVVNDVLYLSVLGEASVALARAGIFTKILEGKGNIPVIASGYAKIDDTIVLATNALYEAVPLGIIRATFSGTNTENMVETLSPLVHEAENTETLAALILQFKTASDPEENIKPKLNEFIDTDNTKINIPVKTAVIDSFLNTLKIRAKSVKDFVGGKIPKRNIYVRPALNDEVSPQSKKVTFSVALILLALLAVSIGFGLRQKKINDYRNKYKGLLTQAEGELNQAVSIASVSPDKSRELFSNSELKIAEIDSMKIKDAALTDLKKKIEESRAAILGEYRVGAEMYLDLSLLSSGFKGADISFSDGQIFVLDKEGSRVVSIDVASKKSKVVAGPGVINKGESLACYEDRVFVLESDGVYQVDSGKQKVITKSWNGEGLISAFAGNLYVMDKSAGQIYRYPGQGNLFGDKQNWLSAGVSVNFENVKQISLDGSLYALLPQSKILKFSQGSQQNFNIKGVVPEIGSIDAISTSPDNTYVYLLDSAGKRVVVTDKKGVYKAQYVDERIISATNLVVSEADKKIILLTGDKLYSLNIQNL